MPSISRIAAVSLSTSPACRMVWLFREGSTSWEYGDEILAIVKEDCAHISGVLSVNRQFCDWD